MSTHIKKIIEKLFEDIPYSKASFEAKEKAEAAAEKEFAELCKNDENELKAVGSILQKCSTFDDAAKLADIGDAEKLKSHDGEISKKKFVRDFTKVRIFAIISALFFSNSIIHVFNTIIFLEPRNLILFAISILIGWLFLLPCKKQRKLYSYDSIRLAPDARERFFIYCDRYKKRTLNSFLIFLGLTVNFVSLTFERAAMSDMNLDELRALIISNNIYLTVGSLICIKNIIDVIFLTRAADEKSRTASRKYIKKAGFICGIFIAAACGITALLNLFIPNAYPILYLMAIIFTVTFLIVNFKKRAAVVIKNIRINKPRIAVFTAAAIALGFVSYMKTDNYLLQPYIMTVKKVPHADHEITYDDTTGVFTITADEGDFRILHLTDIHIGGSAFSFYKDFKALEACRKLIEYTEPDFVMITGDMVFPMGLMSLSLNNQTPVMEFAAFMRNIGIPWAFTYGNHDTESMATGSREDIENLYRSLSWVNNGNLLYPDHQPKIWGRSNQLIKIQDADGTIRQALFLIDSNDYTGAGLNDYDFIHDDQVEWYAENVKELGEDVKSMVFFHIPLREYDEAYKLLESGSDEVEYYHGIIGETMINSICVSNYESRLFDTAVDLGSTQAMFCGHDHYNNIAMGYKGIRLAYGMSIDYLAMPGIAKDTEQRGGALITIHSDGSYDHELIPLTSIE